MAESIETLTARITNPKLREEYLEMAISSAHAEVVNHIKEYAAPEIERFADVLAEHGSREKAFQLVTHPAYLEKVNDAEIEAGYNVVLKVTAGKNTKLFVRTRCESKQQYDDWYARALMRDGTRDRVADVYRVLARGVTEGQAKRITGLFRWNPYHRFMTLSELENFDRSKDSTASLSGLSQF